MYGFAGDDEESFVQDIKSLLREREEEFFCQWTVLDPVDFQSSDEEGMSVAAYGLRTRLCDVIPEFPSESVDVRSCRTHYPDSKGLLLISLRLLI